VPTPYWSWERIPTSYHGAVRDRTFTDAEVARLAQFQMVTVEKWYTPCASAGPPHQSGPSCAVEGITERLFGRLRAANPNVTTILYWNTMFDFSFYTAHQRMLDLEAAGTRAFLRDETGEVLSLCNDGDVYCNITTFDWTVPEVRALWIEQVTNATATGLVDGIFADHSANEGTAIGGSADRQAPNQLCNGKGAGRACYNFTDTFRDSFNSWHAWATNYTQDVLSKTTGGPVIQGPLAAMNTLHDIVDPNYCDFGGILRAQATSGQAVFEARGSCQPSESCLAAYLAAAEPGTYLHCLYTGDELLAKTSFPEMDRFLGAPNGSATETAPGSELYRRFFASGTEVEWNNRTRKGSITWRGQPTPAPTPPPPIPASCGPPLQDTGLASHDLGDEVRVASLAECCSRCHGKKHCVGYAWHTEEGNRCHFHSTGAKQNPGVVGCTSGFLVTNSTAGR
jgi:hypothetical protein